VAARVPLPQGYSLEWSGKYENMLRGARAPQAGDPGTLVTIFLLLYANLRSLARAGLVLLAVPFSAIGAVWLMWGLDYNVSIAPGWA